MEIMIKKEYLDELYQCAVERNSYLLFSGIEFHVTDIEARDFLKKKLDEIICRIKRAYNPELAELRRRARLCYSIWLRLKDIDKKYARQLYAEYLDTKKKIILLQVGDDGQ